ncbi:MAG: hypothetical protein FWD05_09960 [Oscillospiraceae bacterium]|nr:hypothetical protein [Oscillospiraceae bacterium]
MHQRFQDLKNTLFKKKTKEELDAHYENIELEKGDFTAMVIAAIITFLPVLIIALIVVFGLMWLFVR